MGHQEASPPRQRQRMPHYRRHRPRPRRSHRSPLRATNHSHPLGPGKSNRRPLTPNSRALVESWLGQLTAPAPGPTTRLVSPESRNHLAHHGKRPRSQDSDGSPRHRHPRCADQLWRPHYIPPAQGAPSHHFPLLADSPRKAKRRKRDSSDSSLISSLASRREPYEWNITRTTPEDGEISCFKRLDETEVGTLNASSPMSRVGLEVSTFEKRPRHKTRPDKYDTRKAKSSKTKEKMTGRGREKRESKPRKGKHVTTGKNVMKDFTSEAVTSDRITVHPNLKPGLFDNKRVPKERPIADLSFSEMPFPKQPERDFSQPKGLSNSRLKERRRESRELEHISSFFRAAHVESRSHRPASSDTKHIEASRDERPSCREPSTCSLSPTVLARRYHQQSALPIDSSGSIPDATSNSLDFGTTSSKTTYFTWSTSQQSPQPRNRIADTLPESRKELTRSVTPENIREALARTGVYKETQTRLRDDLDDPRKQALTPVCESSPTRSSMAIHGDAHETRNFAMNRVSAVETSRTNETKREVAELARLKERWNAILPPEWKLRRPFEDETSLSNNQRPYIVSDMPAKEYPSSRHESSQIDCGKRMEEPRLAHCECHDGNFDPNTAGYRRGRSLIPMCLDNKCVHNDDATVDEDQITITSRDAMPPPPVPPPRSNLLRTASPSLQYGISSPMSAETSQAREAQAQFSDMNQSAHMGPYVVAGERHKSNEQSEKLIQHVDSVSWLPQTTTSCAINHDRDQTLSRLSMRPAIYEEQDKKIDLEGVVRLASPPETDMDETIADFIARIESEVGQQTAVDERYQLEPTTEDPTLFTYHTPSTCDIHNQYLALPDDLLNACQHLPVRAIDELGLQNVFETNGDLYDHDLAACTGDRSAEVRTEGRGNDDTNEFLEMSEFWRPNRFSQF